MGVVWGRSGVYPASDQCVSHTSRTRQAIGIGRQEAQTTQKVLEYKGFLRFLRLLAANPFACRGLELKHQGRNVPSALACPAVALAEDGKAA